MVIIVFGGYQLISSLPASHSASPLAVSDGEGGAHSHHFVLNRCIPFRADVCCNLGPCCPGILVSVNSI